MSAVRLTGTPATGFHIRLPNRWTVSVQMGPGTYSDNHDAEFTFDDPARTAKRMTEWSGRVECAAWPDEDVMYPLRDSDSVMGYVEAGGIPALLVRVAAFPASPDLRDAMWTDEQVECVARQRYFNLERVFLYKEVREKMLPARIARMRGHAREAYEACQHRGIDSTPPQPILADLGLSVDSAPVRVGSDET